MLSKINAATVHGIEAVPVVIETDISRGLPALNVVGLADMTVKEAKERIRSAILNSGCEYPTGRITINMAPADIRKKGSHMDLPMAVGILASSRQLFDDSLKEYCFIGELSLDGNINKVTGILPIVMAMRREGIKKVVIPFVNKEEAGLVEGIDVYAAKNLGEIIDHFNLNKKMTPIGSISSIEDCGGQEISADAMDFADVRGQEYAKRAITIAVAGGHGILMTGSPSTGKTMISERIPTIMPKMTYEEVVQSTMIYSVAGLLNEKMPFVSKRPFRRPHHRITPAGLIGGGTYPRPGEITLASGGVLFLDEVGEFDRNLIDTLRQPLEEKKISIVRQGETYIFPADFMLVAATNPCKCGYYGDPEHECKCSQHEIDAYQSKISGPIMDRIDMHLKLMPIKYKELTGGKLTTSEDMRSEVEAARMIQRERFSGTDIKLNHQMSDHMADKYILLDGESKRLLEQAYGTLKLNPRTYLKVKKVARTIADIDHSKTVGVQHIAEALQYREQEAQL